MKELFEQKEPFCLLDIYTVAAHLAKVGWFCRCTTRNFTGQGSISGKRDMGACPGKFS